MIGCDAQPPVANGRYVKLVRAVENTDTLEIMWMDRVSGVRILLVFGPPFEGGCLASYLEASLQMARRERKGDWDLPGLRNETSFHWEQARMDCSRWNRLPGGGWLLHGRTGLFRRRGYGH